MESEKMLINGKWVKSENTMPSVNPTTGDVIGTVYYANGKLVKEAVNVAQMASERWGELSLWERADYLKKMASLIIEKAENLKCQITTEMGRPLAESEIEVYETADMITFFAEDAKAYFEGETLPINSALFPNKFSFTIREPIGVVGVIKPWNYPLELPMWAIAPALLAGNTVVFKPSELTPFVGLEIGKIAQEAELPPGVLNVINGNGTVGELLVHSDVDMISFTGSVETGKKVMKSSSEKLHKTSLELGGSDPFIVLPSADLEESVNAAVWGRFTNCGQVCVSAKRIILVEEIADAFVDKFIKKVSQLKMGDGLDPATDIGPLVSNNQREKLISQVNDAVAKGAALKLGGRVPPNLQKGFFYEPTILTDVTKEMKVLTEEVFGPVATIIVAKDIDDAVKIANDSTFGLGASVWTTNLDDAFGLIQKIKSGMMWINEINVAYPNCTWGGVKNSGIGKDLGKDGVLEYTTIRHINIDYGKAKKRDWWFPYGKE